MPKATPAKRKLSVVERRLASGSVFTAASRPIPLKEPDLWVLRVVNTAISDDRLYAMQAEKGWVYALPEDLAIDPVEVGLKVVDGRIVRGDKGTEVLMKIPKADYDAIVKMKDAENRKMTFGKKATKDAIMAAASQQLGDEGTEFLSRTVSTMEIKDGRALESSE